MNKTKRFAVIGCGFWAQYQIAAWKELPEAELIAVCDQDCRKAIQTAEKFGAKRYYTDARQLFENEYLDYVDIITNVETHAEFVKMAAEFGVAAICQKPLAPDLETAKAMVQACNKAEVPLFVHENFRWQAPIRKVKEIMQSGKVGEVFKGKVAFVSAFPVFDNQPFLAEIDKFIIADIGSHVLDIARYLMGEVDNLRCLTRRVNPKIKGEDVATLLMEMRSGAHCLVEMSYASILEKEAFPQTLILLEGSKGSIRLEHDYVIKVSSEKEVEMIRVAPPVYDWVNLDYNLVQSCMVELNGDFLKAFQEGRLAEITGTDNYRTMQLVYAGYESAKSGKVVKINEPEF
ncbi:putative dehydrogenase [Catalinimonas alkaloidigena]|uniref:Gfo/Idh/MocA family protein n=1 Tax=Catalinimonas alkaloidigena TaxID=1075417 RepID=UPI002404DD81|nr:Gfo/Idh/MocA family oxidoreductase [Catalinimonas alkaloidigena]MDF9796556.1 putative dehydrogenase [Catalinimonas alkaloidigena]